jgi:hypothetical protein
LDSYGPKVYCGPHRLDYGALFTAGSGALARGRAVSELLFGEHSSDQKHAKRCPDCELRANRKIEAQHRQVTCNGDMIEVKG